MSENKMGIAGKELYLVDLLRRRMEYPELKRAVRRNTSGSGPRSC
jgi:phage terminase large subunit-like protein